MVYPPEEYETDAGKNHPLLFFLHGSGDRGGNIFLIAKASPVMIIREQGPPPFIIIAPLLNNSSAVASFLEPYLDRVIDEVLAEYRVDRSRIYLTGLSMGGEAAFRFALNRPELFAAISVLAGFNPEYSPRTCRAAMIPSRSPRAA